MEKIALRRILFKMGKIMNYSFLFFFSSPFSLVKAKPQGCQQRMHCSLHRDNKRATQPCPDFKNVVLTQRLIKVSGHERMFLHKKCTNRKIDGS